MASDGKIVYDVNLDDKNAQKKAKGLGDSLKKVGKIGAVAFAAITAGTVAAVIGITKATDRIDKLSQKIGISRKAFQEWDFILSQSGANIESLQPSMKSLATATLEADKGSKKYLETFEALNINFEDFKKLSPEKQFETVTIALSGMENITERTARASDLLGRAATELAPVFNAGADAIDDMKKQANDLGLVLEDDVIDAGVKLTDEIDQLQRSLGAAGTKILSDLLPAISNVVNFLINDGIPAFSGLIATLSSIPEIIEENETAFIILGVAIGTITALVIAYNIQQAIANTQTTLWAVIAGGATVVTTGLGIAFAFLTSPIGLVILAIGAVIAIGILLVRNWDKIKEASVRFGGAVVDFFNGIGEAIKSGIKSAINFVIDLLNGFFISGWNFQIGILNKIPGVSIPLIPEIPRLAKGGLAFGQTSAIIGDNPNAMADPEVVAPLSKLRSMGIGGGTTTVIIQPMPVNMEIDGRSMGRAITPEVTRIIKNAGGNI